jgi:hypothetical protein
LGNFDEYTTRRKEGFGLLGNHIAPLEFELGVAPFELHELFH